MERGSRINLSPQCNCKLADFGLARSLSVKGDTLHSILITIIMNIIITNMNILY